MPTVAPALEWTRLLTATRQRALLDAPASASPPAEYRSEFDRDFDRCLFATSVRRLQDKAQVFPLEPNDSVRTRLTHSLEVSTIARQLAGIVAQRLAATDRLDPADVTAVQAVAATCGLLHDLGNPPFGHSGESAIRAWFTARSDQLVDPDTGTRLDELPKQQQQDFLRFEGNAQTIRIVTTLQVLADWHGLNLTCGTLSAACKYVARSDEVDAAGDDHGRAKPGFFASETALVERLREVTGTGDARHPITFLVEAADDIVYSVIDLEDGVKKGLLDWSVIRDELLAGADGGVDVAACLDRAERRVDHGPIRLRGRARDEALMQSLRTIIIGRTVEAASEAFMRHEGAIMARDYRGELVKDGDARALVKGCKVIGRRHIYRADSILRLEIMGQRVLHELMDLFWTAASEYDPRWIGADGRVAGTSFGAKVYAMLSGNYRAVFEHAMEQRRLPGLYHRLQLVTDNIAGMTDTYACTLHRHLSNAGA